MERGRRGREREREREKEKEQKSLTISKQRCLFILLFLEVSSLTSKTINPSPPYRRPLFLHIISRAIQHQYLISSTANSSSTSYYDHQSPPAPCSHFITPPLIPQGHRPTTICTTPRWPIAIDILHSYIRHHPATFDPQTTRSLHHLLHISTNSRHRLDRYHPSTTDAPKDIFPPCTCNTPRSTIPISHLHPFLPLQPSSIIHPYLPHVEPGASPCLGCQFRPRSEAHCSSWCRAPTPSRVCRPGPFH